MHYEIEWKAKDGTCGIYDTCGDEKEFIRFIKHCIKTEKEIIATVKNIRK